MAKIAHIDKQLQKHLTYVVDRGKDNERSYESIVDFSGERYKGYYRVGKNGKYGIINSSGYEVVAPKYDDIHPFVNVESPTLDPTYFIAQEGNLRGIMDWQGKIVFPFKYEWVRRLDLEQNFAIVCRSSTEGTKVKLAGIADGIDGEIIIPTEYLTIHRTNEGYRLQNREGLWGFANLKGETIVECKYDDDFNLRYEFTLAYKKVPYLRTYNYDVLTRDGNVVAQFRSDGLANWWSFGKVTAIVVMHVGEVGYLVVVKDEAGYHVEPYCP